MFKEFIDEGDVVDFAVVVVIGGACGPIVSALVSDLIAVVLLSARVLAASSADEEWNARAGATLSRESTLVARPTFRPA